MRELVVCPTLISRLSVGLRVVGKRVDVVLDGDWGGKTPSTRIVAIGAAGTIGPGGLEKHFAACLAEGTGEGAAERGVPC